MQKPLWVSRAEERARQKRFKLIAALLGEIHSPIRILDVGGLMDFWNIVDYRRLGNIHVTLLNQFHQAKLPPHFSSHVGDARCMSEFGPEDFDVVLSNSVMGHVGSLNNQKNMADEIRRIGRRYFVQTPNKYFPIDWRTLIPFFHFLPLPCRATLLHRLPLARFGRFKSYSAAFQWASDVRNLTCREIRILFPEAAIVHERVFGLTKSFMIFSGFELERRKSSVR